MIEDSEIKRWRDRVLADLLVYKWFEEKKGSPNELKYILNCLKTKGIIQKDPAPGMYHRGPNWANRHNTEDE